MVKNDSDCGNHSGWMPGYRSCSNRPCLAAIAGILIAAFAFFIAIVIGFAAIVIVAIVLTAAVLEVCCEYRSRSCTIRSRYDTDCCWCDRNRGRDKTLYHCISGDDQRNCMDSQKTISQEGGGVRYEKRWKIFWIVCGICFLVGIICCGAAWGIGTTLDDIMHGFPEEMKWGSKVTKYIVTDKWDQDDDDRYDEQDDWDDDDERRDNMNGIANILENNGKASYKDINSIKSNVYTGSIHLKKGYGYGCNYGRKHRY